MSSFLKFVKKETLHILRDNRTMLIALLMPVVQILLFGFAISTEVNNVNVAVVAPKWDEQIRQSVNRLSANPYFTYIGHITENDIDQYLRSGKVDAIVVFAHDFDKLITQWKQNGNGKAAMQFIMPPTPIQPKQVQDTSITYLLTNSCRATTW